MTTDQIEIPIIKCNRVPFGDGTDRYIFFCDFCHREHTHSPENGYRAAHCHNPEFPYFNGYILEGK